MIKALIEKEKTESLRWHGMIELLSKLLKCNLQRSITENKNSKGSFGLKKSFNT
jgi:hypothetical protein